MNVSSLSNSLSLQPLSAAPNPISAPLSPSQVAPSHCPLSWDQRSYLAQVRDTLQTLRESKVDSKAPAPAAPAVAEKAPNEPKSSSWLGEHIQNVTAKVMQSIDRVSLVADRYLGPIVAVKEGIHAVHGVEKMLAAESASELAEAAGETAKASAGSVANAAFAVAAFTRDKVAAVAGRVGYLALGPLALAQGIGDIWTGIEQGDNEKIGVGAVRSAAGAAILGGLASANPIAVGVGVALYVGAAIYENREAIGQFVSDAADVVVETAVSVYQTTAQAVTSAVDATAGAVEDFIDWLF